jgi:hypothetical protein
VVLDGGISVAIAGDQRATVVGETPSLKAVVQEICRQAGIELRAYGAPDRRYVGKLENVPLTDAFRSLLRTESYIVWMRSGTPDEPARVRWMRVLGPEPSTPTAAATAAAFAPLQQAVPAAAPPAPPAPTGRFSLSTALLFQAFGTYDPARREQAQREIIERLAQPEQLQRFLATDPKEMTTMFGRYRDYEQTIRRLMAMSGQAEVQAKLEQVLKELAANPNAVVGHY